MVQPLEGVLHGIIRVLWLEGRQRVWTHSLSLGEADQGCVGHWGCWGRVIVSSYRKSSLEREYLGEKPSQQSCIESCCCTSISRQHKCGRFHKMHDPYLPCPDALSRANSICTSALSKCITCSVIPRVLPAEENGACNVVVSEVFVGCGLMGVVVVPSFFARYMSWSFVSSRSKVSHASEARGARAAYPEPHAGTEAGGGEPVEPGDVRLESSHCVRLRESIGQIVMFSNRGVVGEADLQIVRRRLRRRTWWVVSIDLAWDGRIHQW